MKELHSNINLLWRQAFCKHDHIGRTGYTIEQVPELFEKPPLGWQFEKFKDVMYIWNPLICYNCGYQEPPIVE